MTRDAAFLLLLIVTSALLLFVHFVLLKRVLLDARLRPWLRALSIVPVVTPVLAWRGGARALPLTWLACLLAYAALRVAS